MWRKARAKSLRFEIQKYEGLLKHYEGLGIKVRGLSVVESMLAEARLNLNNINIKALENIRESVDVIPLKTTYERG